MTKYYMISIAFFLSHVVGRRWVKSQSPIAAFDRQLKGNIVLVRARLNSLSHSFKKKKNSGY